MKRFLVPAVVLIAIATALVVNQVLYLREAHRTFENYYAFRGCRELLTKTEDSGTCRLDSGQVIRIVEFRGRWYLDGDLPWACIGDVCFGI